MSLKTKLFTGAVVVLFFALGWWRLSPNSIGVEPKPKPVVAGRPSLPGLPETGTAKGAVMVVAPDRRRARIEGTVLSGFSGLPVSEARVLAPASGLVTATGPEGRFRIGPAELNDPVEMRVTAPGFDPERVVVFLGAKGGDPRHVVIHLRATVRLGMRVLEADGTPVMGATVSGFVRVSEHFLRVDTSEEGRLFQATTDRDGRAAVSWPVLPDGAAALDFILVAAGPDGRWASLVNGGFSGAIRELRLPAATALLRVRVGDWIGAPPDSAELTVSWMPSEPEGRHYRLRPRVLGRATISPQVEREAIFRLPPGLAFLKTDLQAEGWWVGPQQATLAGGDEAVIEISPEKVGAPYEGEWVEITARVVDPEGRPVEGAGIGFADKTQLGAEEVWSNPSLLTDQNGRVSLRQRREPGSALFLVASHPEFHFLELDLGRIGEDGLTASPEIVLDPATQSSGVFLRVTGPDGRELEGVRAWWIDGDHELRGEVPLLPARHPDANLVFPLPGAGRVEELRRSGTKGLVFDGPGHRLVRMEIDTLLSRVGVPEPVEIVLPEAIPLDVVVTRSGQPVPGVRVLAKCADAGGSTSPLSSPERVTDRAGRARLGLRAERGTEVFVVAVPPEGVPKAIRWDGEQGSASIELTPPRRIAGRVEMPDGEPTAGARVSFLPEILGRPLQDRFHDATVTDESGEFQFESAILGIPVMLTALWEDAAGVPHRARVETFAGVEDLVLTLHPIR